MRKKIIFVLCILILVFCASCKAPESFDPWDDLGGGGIGETGEKEEIQKETYDPYDIVEISDKQKDETFNGAIEVNLKKLSDLPDGVKLDGYNLVVKKGGTYSFSGKFSGSIIVDECDNEDVRIILAGVNIKTPSDSENPPILIKKTSGLRVITVKEGTENYLKDNELEESEGIIIVKKASLTINGKGTLFLETLGSDATGIKVKKTLTIINTKIEIKATNNGIKADDLIALVNSNIKIEANGDGIKTDKEAETLEEANEWVLDRAAGYIYIKNTSLDINSGDDAISANSGMYIDNQEIDIINIITNNGTPSKITESSSDNADGKAIKVGGITYVNPETNEEIDMPSGCSENYSLVITGGTYFINSNDDAITSKGNLLLEGGNFVITSGDDGIHAEYNTTIKGGDIIIQKCYEGIEGASVEIYGGNIDLSSNDDGINAANSDLRNYDFHIYIAGGNIHVEASGDGVDSNGWIEMTGGVLVIDGPVNGGNGSLDSDRGFIIKGGTLVAIGSQGMVENPSSNSEQCYISINLEQSQSASTPIAIYDENDKLLYELKALKKFQSVIISLESLELNHKYKVKVGETTYEATLSKIGTALGKNPYGGGPGQGQGQGPRPPRP